MIQNFKDLSTRDSGIIYKSTFEQIKKLYAQNPEQAGELAISAIELVLTGEISSNDVMVEIILENLKTISEKSSEKYSQKVNSQKQKKIEDNHLQEIANLLQSGWTQKQVAEKLGISQQKVSYWWTNIKREYPELLEEYKKNTKILYEDPEGNSTLQEKTQENTKIQEKDFLVNTKIQEIQRIQKHYNYNYNDNDNIDLSVTSVTDKSGLRPDTPYNTEEDKSKIQTFNF